MHEPDHEPDDEMEDPEVDEQMDSGVRVKPQRHDEDDAEEEIPYNEEPDIVDHGET